MREPDRRPFLALGAALVALAVLLVVPATRAWLDEAVWEPVRAQADPASGLAVGYSGVSLAFWAVLGALFAWAAYELLFVRLGLEPDRAFFLGLAPFLLFGPLFHALLVAGAIPEGTLLAYFAAEPLIYLSTAVLAFVALLLGRLSRRRLPVTLGVGLAFLAPLLVLAARRVSPSGAGHVALLVAMALAAALPLAWAYTRWKRHEPFGAVAAVVGAHALDGATTWMVLRDPFGLGYEGFGERNPVSLALVNLANGWPYFAVKLALPVVLLSLVKVEEGEERLKAFLLFAVFILGFGPGTSNLLQVLFL